VITVNGVESEQAGIDFLTNLHGHSNWKKTSYSNSIRKNYAGVGYTYDASRDAFISIKPYTSWTLDETTCQWKAPIDYPTDGNHYIWDESTTSWTQRV
jgi:hypothetical protein